MSPTQLTPAEVAAGDQLATILEKMWGWYLTGGILSLVFGFVVLSYKSATLYAIAYFAGAFFIAIGVFQLVGAFSSLKERWPYLVMGVVSAGAGIALFVWPKETLYVVTPILIGWVLLFWGIVDIITSLMNRRLQYGWPFLLRGIVSILLGVWAIRHPGNALTVLVVVIGLWAILMGTIEIIGAFQARHARRHWDDDEGPAGHLSAGGPPPGRAPPVGSTVRLVSFQPPLASARPEPDCLVPGVVVGDDVVDLTDPGVGLPAAWPALGGGARPRTRRRPRTAAPTSPSGRAAAGPGPGPPRSWASV